MCTRACVRVRVRVRVDVNVRTCVCVCTRACVCVRVRVRVDVNVRTCACVCLCTSLHVITCKMQSHITRSRILHVVASDYVQNATTRDMRHVT